MDNHSLTLAKLVFYVLSPVHTIVLSCLMKETRVFCFALHGVWLGIEDLPTLQTKSSARRQGLGPQAGRRSIPFQGLSI